jgi:hypothetical protein
MVGETLMIFATIKNISKSDFEILNIDVDVRYEQK